MSSHKSELLTLSPKARQDFIEILRYTGEAWGEKQLLTYSKRIHDALQFIAQNPQLGYRRNDLPPTHQAHLVGPHIIIYRMHVNGVAIVRILHQRMSLSKHI